MREDTFRAALGCLTDAIHAEPIAAWFGDGWRASADGQHFYLGGPGEGGGTVNAHYGRDPIVKIYTTITRSEEHTSELQSLMRISYAVFCLKKKKPTKTLQLKHKLSIHKTH